MGEGSKPPDTARLFHHWANELIQQESGPDGLPRVGSWYKGCSQFAYHDQHTNGTIVCGMCQILLRFKEGNPSTVLPY
jgi:hypothetical protein